MQNVASSIQRIGSANEDAYILRMRRLSKVAGSGVERADAALARVENCDKDAAARFYTPLPANRDLIAHLPIDLIFLFPLQLPNAAFQSFKLTFDSCKPLCCTHRSRSLKRRSTAEPSGAVAALGKSDVLLKTYKTAESKRCRMLAQSGPGGDLESDPENWLYRHLSITIVIMKKIILKIAYNKYRPRVQRMWHLETSFFVKSYLRNIHGRYSIQRRKTT